MAEQIQGTEIIKSSINNEILIKTIEVLSDHNMMGNATLAAAAMYPFMTNIRLLIRRPFSGTFEIIGESTCYTIGAGCLMWMCPKTRYFLPFIIITSGIYYMLKSEKRAFEKK